MLFLLLCFDESHCKYLMPAKVRFIMKCLKFGVPKVPKVPEVGGYVEIKFKRQAPKDNFNNNRSAVIARSPVWKTDGTKKLWVVTLFCA